MEQVIPRLSVSGYFQILSRVLGEPRAFFVDLSETAAMKQAAGFLVVSSLFFAAAALLVHGFSNPAAISAVLFVNAIGMTFISAGLGYALAIIVTGRQISFAQVFTVYAYASGAVFLAAWIPLALFLTEPWKWWLIGTGLNRTCGVKRWHCLLIVGLSIGILIAVFWSLLPIFS
ncbi:MAG: hypothetical protein KGY61_06465 [Desulfobacterales bacterium]|nr:hypothetical protein [Desulfobacterales bacterium]